MARLDGPEDASLSSYLQREGRSPLLGRGAGRYGRSCRVVGRMDGIKNFVRNHKVWSGIIALLVLAVIAVATGPVGPSG